MKFRCLVIALTLLAALASDSRGQSQPTPQIQTQEKAGEAPNSQPKTDTNNSKIEPAPVAAPPPSANHSDQKSATESPKSSEETSGGTEYWVHRGYKVKITDGLLVLFTLGLVIIGIFQAAFLKGALEATAIAARAADLSAKAVIALQLPIIRARQPSSLGHGQSTAVGVTREDCWIPHVEFWNNGSTKAFPVEVHYGIIVGNKPLPKLPLYDATVFFEVNETYEPNTRVPYRVNLPECRRELTDGQWSEIRQGKLGVTFYCLLAYFDFMDTRREVGFCWRWESQRWVPDATPAYNRKT
jgi:hypothetical protein